MKIKDNLTSILLGCAILMTFGLESGMATEYISVPMPDRIKCYYNNFLIEACEKACGSAENWEARSSCKDREKIITCYCKKPVQK